MKWVGQDGQDRTGAGPNVGPDGFEDAHLTLAKLSPKAEIKSVEVAGPGRPGLARRAEPQGARRRRVRPPGRRPDPGRPLFQPRPRPRRPVAQGDHHLRRRPGRRRHRRRRQVQPGQGHAPAARPGAGRQPRRPPDGSGQDGVEASPGDVHVALGGPRRGRQIVAAALSDGVVGTWVFKPDDQVRVRRRLRRRPAQRPAGRPDERADLVFPPIRDESGATMTLRLARPDRPRGGRSASPAARATPAGRAPAAAAGSVDRPAGRRPERPGRPVRDGHASSKGTYPLARPAGPGPAGPDRRRAGRDAAVRPGGRPAPLDGRDQGPRRARRRWRASRSGSPGPVRWDREVGFGPAVIGTTDDRDRPARPTPRPGSSWPASTSSRPPPRPPGRRPPT